MFIGAYAGSIQHRLTKNLVLWWPVDAHCWRVFGLAWSGKVRNLKLVIAFGLCFCRYWQKFWMKKQQTCWKVHMFLWTAGVHLQESARRGNRTSRSEHWPIGKPCKWPFLATYTEEPVHSIWRHHESCVSEYVIKSIRRVAIISRPIKKFLVLLEPAVLVLSSEGSHHLFLSFTLWTWSWTFTV